MFRTCERMLFILYTKQISAFDCYGCIKCGLAGNAIKSLRGNALLVHKVDPSAPPKHIPQAGHIAIYALRASVSASRRGRAAPTWRCVCVFAIHSAKELEQFLINSVYAVVGSTAFVVPLR